MSDSLIRSLSVRIRNREIGRGCPIHLEGTETLSLRPGYFLLRVEGLPDTTLSLLTEGAPAEVFSDSSLLLSGEIRAACTALRQGRKVTEISVTTGQALWSAFVSLSLAPGLSLRETANQLLSAAGLPPLISFSGRNSTFSRPQAFFGRAADALLSLAETAEAEVFRTPAGLVMAGLSSGFPSLILEEKDLLSAPVHVNGETVLRTSMTGWPSGSRIFWRWQDSEGHGRILSRFLSANNVSGSWKQELLVADL